MKKIACISDTHGLHRHPKLRNLNGDILIHSGDFTSHGKREQIRNFAQWIYQQDFKFKCIIAGNHDTHSELDIEGTRAMFNFPGVYYLLDEMVEIDGLKIYGSPWTPEFCNWSWMLERGSDELKQKWNRIPEGLDILMTHGPPFGILDRVSRGHVGCELLREAVDLKKPKYHIFGHIHTNYPNSQVHVGEHTTFINASILNDYYNPANDPVIFEI